MVIVNYAYPDDTPACRVQCETFAATHSGWCQNAVHAAHWLWPQVSRARREHRNIFSCESEHYLFQELGSVQPDSRHLVISRKAADTVSEAASGVPDSSHLLGAI